MATQKKQTDKSCLKCTYGHPNWGDSFWCAKKKRARDSVRACKDFKRKAYSERF